MKKGLNKHGREVVCWLDLVTLRYSAWVDGLIGLAFTLIDMLASVPEVKICMHYELDGKKIDFMPQTPEEFSRCKPVYASRRGQKRFLCLHS